MRRRHAPLALCLGISTAALVALGLALAATSAPTRRYVVDNHLGSLLFALGFTPVGALLALRRPANRISWLVCAMGMVAAISLAADATTLYLVRELGVAPATVAWLAWAGHRLDCSRRPRRDVPAAAVPKRAAAVAALAARRLVERCRPGPPHAQCRGRPGRADGHAPGHAQPPGADKWFAYVCAMVVIGQVFGPVAQALGAQGNWVWVPLLLAIAGIPISIGVAVLRYRLYEIDRIINRTLVYGLLTAVLGVAYAGVVLTLGQLFGGLGAEPPSWAVAGATLAVATLFQPLRRRIQSAVDRRFNRRRYDAAKTIEAFSGRLREEVDLDTLSAELLAVVDQTMQPTQSSLWLRPSAQRSGRAVIIKRKLSPVGDNPRSGPRTVCRLVSGYDLYASPE